jgi:HSP20 family protein
MFRDLDSGQLIKVEEFTEDATLVIRAEIPGVDPEKDVEITVEGRMLHITAHRTEEEEKKERDFYRRELRYGSFERSIPLPEGADGQSVTATYGDGMLEVRIPLPEPEKQEARRVTVSRK